MASEHKILFSRRRRYRWTQYSYSRQSVFVRNGILRCFFVREPGFDPCDRESLCQYGNRSQSISGGLYLFSVHNFCIDFHQFWKLLFTQGSSVVGNANSGKTQTVMGLANLLGKFIFMIRCTDTTDSVSVGKILQVILLTLFNVT